MYFMASSKEYICIPVSGPADDLTSYPVYVAVIAEDAGEPDTLDYQTGSWINGEACWKPVTDWGTDIGSGAYFAYVRVVAAADGEDVRLPSGRVRIGDVR